MAWRTVQKFRFCGGMEPPDWVLAEIPLLSGKDAAVKPSDVVGVCDAISADISLKEITQAQVLFECASDAKAVVAVLRFILTHAAKYDAKRADLVEELQQLGMHQDAAEAIAQSYEEHRGSIQSQQRAQRFQFPSIEKLEWKVGSSSKVKLDLKLDQPVLECGVISTSSASGDGDELHVEMSRDKFLALYEELAQTQRMLQG